MPFRRDQSFFWQAHATRRELPDWGQSSSNTDYRSRSPCAWLLKRLPSKSSIRRRAFPNAPVGSFPKTSDQLDLNRVTSREYSLERKNADRYCEVVQWPEGSERRRKRCVR